MKKFIILGGIATVAVAGAAIAQPRPLAVDMTRQQVVQQVEQRFATLDQDRDGQISPEERRAVREQRRGQALERRFQRMDLDSNGSVTLAEMRQAHEQLRAEPGEHRRFARNRARRGAAMREGGQARQGPVTLEQMRERALARFDRLDADRNGIVTATEREQAKAGRRDRRRAR